MLLSRSQVWSLTGPFELRRTTGNHGFGYARLLLYTILQTTRVFEFPFALMALPGMACRLLCIMWSAVSVPRVPPARLPTKLETH